jgi:hypothetical protein
MQTEHYEYEDDAVEPPQRPLMRWRVYLRSVPGMYEQYDGHVDVHSSDASPQELFQLAVAALRASSFPDRRADCWRFVSADLLN